MTEGKSEKKKTGRPKGAVKLQFDEETLSRVETLAGYGLNQIEVASVIGISERTLLQYKRDNEKFLAAWRRGKEKAKAYVAGKLMEKVKEKDMGAIKWYEQTRCGMSEKIKTENEHTHKVEPLEDYLKRKKKEIDVSE